MASDGVEYRTIRCEVGVHRRLKILAAVSDRTISQAISDLLDRNEQREGGESK